MAIKIMETIYQKARSVSKTIVLSDGEDERSIKAAAIAVKEKLAKIVLIGNEANIYSTAKKADIDLDGLGVQVIEPGKSNKKELYKEIFLKNREQKGKPVLPEEAQKRMEQPLFYAGMMVLNGDADGEVGGSLSSTADVIKAGLLTVGTPEGTKTVSSYFVMVPPDNKIFLDECVVFADCAVVPNPSAEQLADIAVISARNARKLLGLDPKIALLSFSSRGSAAHPDVDKVTQALKIAREKAPDLLIDGELQFDTAVIPEIAKRKVGDSLVAGKANVFIFPDLDAGNIAYKITQRLGNFLAIGPVVQGFKKPFFDLSRGCSVQDIVDVIAIASVSA